MPARLVPITDDRVLARRYVEEFVKNLVKYNSFQSLPNEDGESRQERDAYLGMMNYFGNLPLLCAKSGPGLDDMYAQGIGMGDEMADVITAYPCSELEEILEDFLEKETRGKSKHGQKISGLLDEEIELLPAEKQKLVFYRAMREELQTLRQLRNQGIERPKTVARENLETLVESLVRLNTVTYDRYEYPSERLDKCRVSVAFNNLPRLYAQPSDTLDEFFQRGIVMAKEMAVVIAAHPSSEKFVKDYLKKETAELEVSGQEAQNGLLAEERTLMPLEQEKLAFYQGMGKELQRLIEM